MEVGRGCGRHVSLGAQRALYLLTWLWASLSVCIFCPEKNHGLT